MNQDNDHGSEWLINQIAHALRNPIFAGLVQTELLGLRMSKDSEAGRALEMLRSQLHRLETIVSDMLRFGRPVVVSPRHLQVTDLLQAMVTECAQGACGEPAQLEMSVVPEGLEVEWDPTAVRNILAPVITNAVQHTEPPHPITLEVHETDHGTVRLAIRDQGGGIPDDLLTQALLPFAPQHHGRPGLGLAIARKFAAALGGTLAITTTVGEGTEVLIELPARVAATPADGDSPVSAPAP
jgi:signal transduction histidine kinase